MRAPYTVPDRFAGSILDLQPDTDYEVRLTAKDPDGVSGTVAGSKAVDAGMKIPNVNDGFAGRAPDLVSVTPSGKRAFGTAPRSE